MGVDRVNSADSRVYVNNDRLIGVTNFSINYDRGVEELRALGSSHVVDRILISNQTPSVDISWVLGDDSSDPFFDHQTEGLISVESFNIKKRDTAGSVEIHDCFLTSYSIDASVGSLVNGSITYEGSLVEFLEVEELTQGDSTEDYYDAFLPSTIQLSASFEEGQIFELPIQSFDINVSIPRETIKKMGDLTPEYRYPTLPLGASVSFSVIKSKVKELDFTRILMEKGNFVFEMSSCQGLKKGYILSHCSLIGVGESLNIDGNAELNFEYAASLTRESLVFGGDELFIPEGFIAVFDIDGNYVYSVDDEQLIAPEEFANS